MNAIDLTDRIDALLAAADALSRGRHGSDEDVADLIAAVADAAIVAGDAAFGPTLSASTLSTPPLSAPPALDTHTLVAAIRAVDRTERHGGLVPVERVRAALACPRAETDRALLAAESSWIVDLKIANDPARLGVQGLETTRGVAGWVVVR